MKIWITFMALTYSLLTLSLGACKKTVGEAFSKNQEVGLIFPVSQRITSSDDIEELLEKAETADRRSNY